MRTVNEVSKITGVSIRTLHYYDEIGLLHPSEITEAGYRLYDDTALERLQQILLFRELEFPLKEIKSILGSKKFDRKKALEQQIELLILKKEHLEELIEFAREIQSTGEIIVDFTAFNNEKIEEYKKEAKKQWGDTAAYKEFEAKDSMRSNEERQKMGNELMDIFAEFGKVKHLNAGDEKVQALVAKLRKNITDNWYNCDNNILAGLGQMYCAGGELTDNIDKVGGEGCAEFCANAIEIFTA